MQARGIPRPEAESLLVTAFLEDVLSRIKDAAIREELIQKLEERLET
jgi:Fe-S cluster assembly scaffold protein SufB